MHQLTFRSGHLGAARVAVEVAKVGEQNIYIYTTVIPQSLSCVTKNITYLYHATPVLVLCDQKYIFTP